MNFIFHIFHIKDKNTRRRKNKPSMLKNKFKIKEKRSQTGIKKLERFSKDSNNV